MSKLIFVTGFTFTFSIENIMKAIPFVLADRHLTNVKYCYFFDLPKSTHISVSLKIWVLLSNNVFCHLSWILRFSYWWSSSVGLHWWYWKYRLFRPKKRTADHQQCWESSLSKWTSSVKGVVRDFGHGTSFPRDPVCYLSLEISWGYRFHFSFSPSSCRNRLC